MRRSAPWLAAGLIAVGGCDAPPEDPMAPPPAPAEASARHGLVLTPGEAEALSVALDDVVHRVLPALGDAAAREPLRVALTTLQTALEAGDAAEFGARVVQLRSLTVPLFESAVDGENWLADVGVLLHTLERTEMGITEEGLAAARVRNSITSANINEAQ